MQRVRCSKAILARLEHGPALLADPEAERAAIRLKTTPATAAA